VLRSALLLTVLISPLLGVLIASGGNPVVTIAVDLYHAPYSNGLDVLIESCPGCRWILVVYAYDPGAWALGDRYRGMGYNVEVRQGGFGEGVLDGVDMLVIGAFHGDRARGFEDWELGSLTGWWASGERRVIWIASVGDFIVEYPRITSLGPTCIVSNNPPARAFGWHSQFNANRLLEALGSRIRVDMASISSPWGPVEGFIVSGALGLKEGKVILPMAAPLYVVQGNTTVNPFNTSLEGISVVVYAESTISNYDNPREVRDLSKDPVFYEKGAKGTYPVMVVERLEGRMVVVSGDTMVGGFIGAYASGCHLNVIQAGLYSPYWEWPASTGEVRKENYEGPALVKATIAHAVRFIAGERAEELLSRKPRTETTTEHTMYTTGYPESWYVTQAPETGYYVEGERLAELLTRLALVFIVTFVIVLSLLRLLRRA